VATDTPRTQAVLNIYRELRRDDQTLTQRKFATDYLNRCPAYIPSTRNQGREFSDKAIVCLVRQLRSISCQRQSKFPQLRQSNFPHPVQTLVSSARTSPAFSFSFRRYEFPRMLSVTA